MNRKWILILIVVKGLWTDDSEAAKFQCIFYNIHSLPYYIRAAMICFHLVCSTLEVNVMKGGSGYNVLTVNANSFVPNAPFLYPVKTSENLTNFCCLQGVEKGCTGN